VSKIIELIRGRRSFVENFVALLGSTVALGIATLVVARIGGPAAVGNYALLRILPWLVAVIVSGGLAGSIAYFLAGPMRGDPRVRATLIAIAIAGAAGGALVWIVGTPLLQHMFFRHLSLGLIAVVAVRVVLRMSVITGKAAAQGSGDLSGSNLTILFEELLFLPAFGLVLALNVRGDAAVIAALILSDLATSGLAWTRLARKGFFTQLGRPSVELARRIYLFGVRGQLGSLLMLLNLRYNFVLLAALAGPVTLGIYTVASKYAEVLRMLPIAANWVLYPRFARSDARAATEDSRRLIPRAGTVTAVTALPLALAAGIVVPFLFGDVFRAAVLPAQILLIGLAAEGVAGVSSAFLLGRGRPGLNSLGAAAGVVVTVILNFMLVPRYGAVGAAIASSVAFLTTTTTLYILYRVVTRTISPPAPPEWVIPGLPSTPPSGGQRVLDVAVALTVLVVSGPLLLILGAASRLSTGGSAIFSQVRVGQGGVPFTMYKFRSMRPGVAGPEVTGPGDPRVTRVGAALRATSLDELPQLLNVLRGEMTLVGPRPETVALALRYPPGCREVFAHRPGLTGPVQVQMRDAVPDGVEDIESYYLTELLPKRTELDLAYLANPSLRSTVALIAETAKHVLSRIFVKLAAGSRRNVDIVVELKTSG
jgi:lipopolysaccharide/colanic/teichoic acid biosynthesis glycosyltransferase/O-antigen/teichoic acid export membrane protein